VSHVHGPTPDAPEATLLTGKSAEPPLSDLTAAAFQDFLTRRPALCEVLRLAQGKLTSLDGARGTLVLTDFDHRDAAQSIGARLTGKARNRVRVADLDRALRGTSFGISLRQALEVLVGRPVVTKADQVSQRAAAIETFRTRLRDAARRAVPDATRQCEVDARIHAWWEADRSDLSGMAQNEDVAATAEQVATALGVLTWRATDPDAAPLSIPELALRAAGHPHAFDVGRSGGRLFDRALSQLAPPEAGVTTIGNAEDRATLYAAFNLVVDELSSTVAVFGMTGNHAVLAASTASRAVIVLPLLTVDELGSVFAPGRRVFAVENPAVFMGIVRMLRAGQLPVMPAVVCTSGHLSVAARRLLARLVAGGASVWYSGDFDRHGLDIAMGLHRRWPDAICPWRWTPDDHARARGESAVRANRDVEAGLDTDFPSTITSARACIDRDGDAFQEGIIELLVEDVRRFADDLNRPQ
jgi:uncharacterized protein (TIGR02679 family)